MDQKFKKLRLDKIFRQEIVKIHKFTNQKIVQFDFQSLNVKFEQTFGGKANFYRFSAKFCSKIFCKFAKYLNFLSLQIQIIQNFFGFKRNA